MQRADKEGGVRPVEDVGIQRVVATARTVDTLDGDVVVTHLHTGDWGSIAVEDNSADRVQRPQQPWPAFPEERRMIFDRRAQLRMHILHGSRPRSLQHPAPVTEVSPRQRIRPQRQRRGFVTQR
ncbi:Uncharacterised protein [Mycobacterium tuberculosis]|nr:Uncharacterised protein [Mycobacterium tuberculosis]